MRLPAKTAFSLIELLVALSILAVVAAIIVPRFLNVRSQAEATVIAATEAELQHALDSWQSLGGAFTGAPASASATAAAFLQMLVSTANPRTGTAGGVTATDGGGSFGSSVIGLNITLNVATPGVATALQNAFDAGTTVTNSPGFYYRTTGPCFFVTQSGAVKTVTISSISNGLVDIN